MWHAVFRGLNDLNRFCSAEGTASVFEHSNLGSLTRQNMVYKNNSALVPGNEDAAVRHLLDGHFKTASQPGFFGS